MVSLIVEGLKKIEEDDHPFRTDINEFDTCTMGFGCTGFAMCNPSPELEQVVAQTNGNQELLTHGQRHVGFEKNAFLADIQGSGHGTVNLPAGLIHEDVIEQVQSIPAGAAAIFNPTHLPSLPILN